MKINIIKTDKGICFISDCDAKEGYNHDYHYSKLPQLLFDGVHPEKTLHKNWYQIYKFPEEVTRVVPGEKVNKRYELWNADLESKAMPLALNELSCDDSRYEFYQLKYDTLPDTEEDVTVEWDVICEVNNFKPSPVIEYPAIETVGWEDRKAVITNANFKHSLIDLIVTPEPILAALPCEISASDLYKVIRKHVQDNIDPKVAVITSDYDFCFTVKKRVTLLQEHKYSYTNPFARTKKQRSKVHYKVDKEKTFEVFEMAPKSYQNYSVLTPIVAENEWQLKEDIDTMLSDIMEVINKPLQQCECCNGTGYLAEEK